MEVSNPVAQITPFKVLGLSTGVKGNAHFLTNVETLQIVGNVFAIQNHSTKENRFFKIPRTNKLIQSIVVAPDKSVLAVVEKGKRPTIAVYSLETFERIKLLGNPFKSAEANEFISVAFTCCSQYVIGLTGPPEYTLIYYDWNTGKVESYIDTGYPDVENTVYQVAPNPRDNTVVVVIGNGLFQMMSVAESVWRQYGFQKADSVDVTCAAWLTPDKVIAGTRDGRFFVAEYGDLRGVFLAQTCTEMNVKPKDESQGRASIIELSDISVPEDYESGAFSVQCLVAFDKGFAFSCQPGVVVVFEKRDKFFWFRKNVIKVFTNGVGTMSPEELSQISHLDVCPSEDAILCSTQKTTLYYSRILQTQYFETEPILTFKILGSNLHQGEIRTIATCIWKPIFLTAGVIDQAVRVWNYETGELVLVREFPDDIYSASMHPTGFYCLLGFTDKLKFLNILYGDLKPIRHVDIKTCPLSAFSNNGHLFAAVNVTAIHVYSSITFDKVHVLKGHLGPVTRLIFSSSDKLLLSCGGEGSLYHWHLRTGERIGDYFTEKNGHNDVTMTNDSVYTYSVGTDGCLKEISNDQFSRNINMKQGKLNSIALAHSNQMMFVAGDSGNVASIVYPLIYPVKYDVFQIHTAPVTKVVISQDDKRLISLSEDGVICIWKIEELEGKCFDMNRGFGYISDILMTTDDLEEKDSIISELTLRMTEIESEHAYIIRQIKTSNEAYLKKVHEGYLEFIEYLKSRIKQLDRENMLELNECQLKLDEAVAKCSDEIEMKERSFGDRLISEYDKYESLVQLSQTYGVESEEFLSNLSKKNMVLIKEMLRSKQHIIDELNEKVQKVQTKLDLMIDENENLQAITKGWFEYETNRITRGFQDAISAVEDSCSKYLSHNDVLTKKSEMLLKDVKQLKVMDKGIENGIRGSLNVIKTLKLKRDELKSQALSRKQEIEEKQELVERLQRENERCLKEKIAGESIINDLRAQVEPKDILLKNTQEYIEEASKELRKMKKRKMKKDRLLLSLKRNKATVWSEVRKARDYADFQSRLLKEIKDDLAKAPDHAFKTETLYRYMRKIISRHLQDEDFQQVWLDKQVEFVWGWQREYLQGAVSKMRQEIETQSVPYAPSYDLMEKNLSLVHDLKVARTSFQELCNEMRNLEGALGVNKNTVKGVQFRGTVKKVIQPIDKIKHSYMNVISRQNHEIKILHNELMRLNNDQFVVSSENELLDMGFRESEIENLNYTYLPEGRQRVVFGKKQPREPQIEMSEEHVDTYESHYNMMSTLYNDEDLYVTASDSEYEHQAFHLLDYLGKKTD